MGTDYLIVPVLPDRTVLATPRNGTRHRFFDCASCFRLFRLFRVCSRARTYRTPEWVYFAAEDSFVQNSGCSALMMVFRNEERWDTSNVEMDGNRIKLYSKTRRNPLMTHIDYGLGILKPEVFEKYPEGTNFDLAEIYEHLSESGRLASFEAKHRFYEIGSHDGLVELNEILCVRNER